MPREYAPPPGAPPNYQHQYPNPSNDPPNYQEQYAPPPGPPPSHAPQHNWQAAVPDTSLLPPPPSLTYNVSPTNNATDSDAVAAEKWLRNRPLQPNLHIMDRRAVAQADSGDVMLKKPPIFFGDLRMFKTGNWRVNTKVGSPDSCIVSATPLYSVQAHSPLQAEHPKTIYFEAKILPSNHSSEIPLALGFVALPYPPFRLPGWERASLGVHGDDGHRYVNNNAGGKEFTQPFRRGQTVGIGMTFSKGLEALDVEVFFTRDGKRDGGWNIHEELDAQDDRSIHGLEGMHDLYAAIGTFNAVEFEVHFVEKDWLYKP